MVIKNPYLTIIEKNIVVLEPENVIIFAQDLRSESDYGKTVSVFLQSLIKLEALFYQEKLYLFDKNPPLIRNLPPELRCEMIILKWPFRVSSITALIGWLILVHGITSAY